MRFGRYKVPTREEMHLNEPKVTGLDRVVYRSRRNDKAFSNDRTDFGDVREWI